MWISVAVINNQRNFKSEIQNYLFVVYLKVVLKIVLLQIQ